jgi:hypothetical protein
MIKKLKMVAISPSRHRSPISVHPVDANPVEVTDLAAKVFY